MKIPSKFYKAGNSPTAKNVGELKELLAELPDDLRVNDGWGNTPQLVVFNYGSNNQYLSIRDGDEDDED